MLDFDLARIYGYETRYLNRQVKNNADRLDNDFMFQLTREEWAEILKCKNFTSNWGGNRKLPFAFTEQGLYMLMPVLRGDFAIRQSKTLIRLWQDVVDHKRVRLCPGAKRAADRSRKRVVSTLLVGPKQRRVIRNPMA